LKDLCAFEFTSYKLNWIKYLDTQRMQKNFLQTVATLKWTIQQKPKCLQRFSFCRLGRRFESVLCTQKLHTFGTRTSSCFSAMNRKFGRVSCRQRFMDLRWLSLTLNQEINVL